IASAIAEGPGGGQCVGICQAGSVLAARLVLRDVVPAGGLADDVRLADKNRRSRGVVGIERVGQRAAGVHSERMPGVEGVNTGGPEVAEDPRKRTAVQHALAVAEGQLVDIADRDTMANVEVA